jgi:hypothetical protein
MSVTVWDAVLADAVSRIEWVKAQTDDADRQMLLLPLAGSGGELPENVRTPEPLRKERARAARRERLSRFLGQRKGLRWAERTAARGPFNPATITEAEAEAVLVTVSRYVARWSGPTDAHPLSPEGREDVTSAIVGHIWTRDYADGAVRSLAQAVWQACKLWRRCGWRASPEKWKEAMRAGRAKGGKLENRGAGKQGLTDDPARIAAAAELAAAGLLTAPTVQNRGRVKRVGRFHSRTIQGVQYFTFHVRKTPASRKRMPAVDRADATAAIVG